MVDASQKLDVAVRQITNQIIGFVNSFAGDFRERIRDELHGRQFWIVDVSGPHPLARNAKLARYPGWTETQFFIEHEQLRIENRPSCRHEGIRLHVLTIQAIKRADVGTLGRAVSVGDLAMTYIALEPLAQTRYRNRLATEKYDPQTTELLICRLSAVLDQGIKCARRAVHQRDSLLLDDLRDLFRVVSGARQQVKFAATNQGGVNILLCEVEAQRGDQQHPSVALIVNVVVNQWSRFIKPRWYTP